MTGHRGHRGPRGFIALGGAGVLAAALLTGCGSSSHPTAHGSPTTSSGQQQAVRQVADVYAKTNQAGTAKIAVSGEVYAQGRSVPVTANGLINFGHRAAELTVQLPAGTGTIEERYLNGMIYLKLPPSAESHAGVHTPWISLNVNKLAQQRLGTSLQQLESSSPRNPADVLGYLQGTGQQVRDLGPATVTVTPTTHYAVTIDLNKAAAHEPAAAKQAIQRLEQQTGLHDIPAELWVDHQGRLREPAMTETIRHPAEQNSGAAAGPVTVKLTETLSDYGTTANISAPQANHTTDLTSKVAGH